MDNSNYLKLKLGQPLLFPSAPNLGVEKLDQALTEVKKRLDVSDVGTDYVIACQALLTSEMCVVSFQKAASREINENSFGGITLDEGFYKFFQLPSILNSNDTIVALLNRFALSLDFSESKQKSVLIRLYKEAPQKSVIQFFSPIQTTEE
ncbi:MAG: hypothetical protein WCY53_01165 [Sphaerochaetaceae bacterium]